MKPDEMQAAAAAATPAAPDDPKNRPVKKIGYLFGILAAFFYSIQSPMTKLLLAQGYDSYQITAFMFLFGAVAVNGYALVTRKWDAYAAIKQHFWTFLAIGGGYFVSFLCSFKSLKYLNAGISSVLFYLSPVIICLFYLITKIKPVKKANLIAVAFAILGCTLTLNLFGSGVTQGVTTIGVCLALVAVAGQVFGHLTTDLKAYSIDPFALVLYNTTIGGILAVVCKPVIVADAFHLSWQYFLIFVFMAVAAKLLPAACFYREMKCIGAERTSVVGSIQTPMTLVICYFVLGETMLPIQLVGVAIVIVAVLILQLKS